MKKIKALERQKAPSGSFPIFFGSHDVGHADVATERGVLVGPPLLTKPFRFPYYKSKKTGDKSSPVKEPY